MNSLLRHLLILLAHKEKTIENLKSMYSLLPGHIYIKDINGVYLWCNYEQARALNLKSYNDLVGKTDYDLSEKTLADQFWSVDQTVMREKKAIEVEEKILKNGKEAITLTKKIPAFDKTHKVIGVLGISFDITDRKKIEEELHVAKEEAEAANYLMTEFISNMGHDLATPISDVGSVAEALRYYSDEYVELQDLIQTLIDRSAACETVRKKIINATAISNLEVKHETFSIIDELLVLEKELRSLIGEKPLKLVLHPLKPKKDDVIKTDRTKFHDILHDLISNAINFTEKGEVSISVFKKDNMFHIKVADTGIGIPKDKFEYIFKQYAQITSKRYVLGKANFVPYAFKM